MRERIERLSRMSRQSLWFDEPSPFSVVPSTLPFSTRLLGALVLPASTFNKSTSTLLARSPTPTSGLCSQHRTNCSTTSGRAARAATSVLRVSAALWMMARASRFAPGSGEPSAVMREGGSAMARDSEKESGERSLMVRERRGVGSWVVERRTEERRGRSVGRRGGMLAPGSLS